MIDLAAGMLEIILKRAIFHALNSLWDKTLEAALHGNRLTAGNDLKCATDGVLKPFGA